MMPTKEVELSSRRGAEPWPFGKAGHGLLCAPTASVCMRVFEAMLQDFPAQSPGHLQRRCALKPHNCHISVIRRRLEARRTALRMQANEAIFTSARQQAMTVHA